MRKEGDGDGVRWAGGRVVLLKWRAGRGGGGARGGEEGSQVVLLLYLGAAVMFKV